MIPPKKSNLPSPKRVIEWFYEPEETPEQLLLRQLRSAWSVLQEKPPPVNVVILVTDGKDLALGRVDDKGKISVDGQLQPVTHWLPLPAPPDPVPSKGKQSIFKHRDSWRGY